MTHELKRQASGAFALHNREAGETMHPRGGPWEEANGLYVQASGLANLLTKTEGGKERDLVVFEVGLDGAADALAAIACHDRLRRRGGKVCALRLISFENDLSPFALRPCPRRAIGIFAGSRRAAGSGIGSLGPA